MVNPRTKGASGEREAARWLASNLKLEQIPERNLEQVRKGGHDLNGLDPFKIEVKRQETLNLRTWWVQAVSSCGPGDCPIVMYRQNRGKWRFLLPAKLIGIEKGYIQLEDREFVRWATKTLSDLAMSNQ